MRTLSSLDCVVWFRRNLKYGCRCIPVSYTPCYVSLRAVEFALRRHTVQATAKAAGICAVVRR